MRDLRELLDESGCSTEFIQDAMRYEKLFTGNVDVFIDKVEEILLNDAIYGDEFNDDDDDDFDDDEDENDPIHQSDYNYDGNEDNIYFEEEADEFEDDEEEED